MERGQHLIEQMQRLLDSARIDGRAPVRWQIHPDTEADIVGWAERSGFLTSDCEGGGGNRQILGLPYEVTPQADPHLFGLIDRAA